jgi:hypothetical protein
MPDRDDQSLNRESVHRRNRRSCPHRALGRGGLGLHAESGQPRPDLAWDTSRTEPVVDAVVVVVVVDDAPCLACAAEPTDDPAPADDSEELSPALRTTSQPFGRQEHPAAGAEDNAVLQGAEPRDVRAADPEIAIAP